MRSLKFRAAIISGYALLTAALTYPLIFHLTTHIPIHQDWHPSGAEHWTSLWAFWFVQHSLEESSRWSFFTDAIFYPRGIDLTNAVLLGFGLTAAIAAPFVEYLSLILLFNLFVIGSFILTGYVTFLLVQHLTGDSRAAFVSGIIFSFSPYQMARALSMFGIVTSGVWIPLYILLFIRAVRGGLVRDIILAPIILTLTLLSNPYYAIFLVLFSLIYSLYYIVSTRALIMQSRFLKNILYMISITVVLFLPLLWIILRHWSSDLLMDVQLSPEFGADLLAFFLPSTNHSLWGESTKFIYYNYFSGNNVEQTVYVGYIVLLLSFIVLAKALNEETKFWFLSSLIFFILSLGPFLHINGRSLFKISEISVMIPLPSLLFHFLPLLSAVRATCRFSIMLMLSLTILVGYGVSYLMAQFERSARIAVLCLVIIGVIIGIEFSVVPLPLADARIPKIYSKIAIDLENSGTVLDVPLYWFVTRYQYYQTAHLKRLLIGQAPRVPPDLLRTYANTMPFMNLFRNPELIRSYEHDSIDKRDILRFIGFFDLSFIVLHKAYMGTTLFDHLVDVVHPPPGEARLQGREVPDRLLRFLLAHFPIEWMEEEGDIVVLKLARTHQPSDLWMDKDGMTLDFGSTSPHFFLTDGWTAPEQSEELTFAWATGKESRLWAYLPQDQNFDMELRVQPFTFPGSPPQGMKIYVNEQFLSYIPLVTPEWHTYTVHLSQTDLTQGINTFRLVYDYTASPATVFPGNEDRRQLAVNFDYITFHPQ